MHLLIELLIDAGVILLMTYLLPSVKVKSYGTAFVVAIIIALLNATIGFIIRVPLNIVTLGLLSFLIRLLVTAVMIKVADKFIKDFEVKGYLPAVLIALALAVAGSLFY